MVFPSLLAYIMFLVFHRSIRASCPSGNGSARLAICGRPVLMHAAIRNHKRTAIEK